VEAVQEVSVQVEVQEVLVLAEVRDIIDHHQIDSMVKIDHIK
jgi:hypothetical protein